MRTIIDQIVVLLLVLPCLPAIAEPAPITPAALLTPRSTLPMKIQHRDRAKVEKTETSWMVSGKPGSLYFVPESGAAWDVSAWMMGSISVRNDGAGVVTVDSQLENPNALSWQNSCPGSAVVPPGKSASIGFTFPRPDHMYQGPSVFDDQLAKPNGHRVHWRSFNLSDVRRLRLVLRASTPEIKVKIGPLTMAWPADAARDARLHEMPYLDRFGQVRALEWPGKIRNETELKTQVDRELSALKRPEVFNRFGGWANGPKRKATGHFRTEKIDGRWWLVDPDGRLFFSTGVCCVGFDAKTKVTNKRRQANFFAWLPDKTDGRVNFPTINTVRVFGDDGWNRARDAVHARMHAWGLNTIAAWSDEAIMRESKTPYTLTTAIYWPVVKVDHERMPSPFSPEFKPALRKQLQGVAWAKDDPYCLGVFIDNELSWPNHFAPLVFRMPGWEPTKKWVLDQLKKKYGKLGLMNQAWGTTFKVWDDFLKMPESNAPARAAKDIDPLYEPYMRAYFTGCKQVLNEVLPNKLYLGCRTHRGPALLGRAAQGSVDVFSVNAYASKPRIHQVPHNVDMPVLVGEFHFGAMDRGVPSPGLHAVHDQQQRGLAYANYLANALAEPRFVGVHWFRWLDQSAAGRGDRENHQCGFLDVTGRAYREFTTAVSRATRAMYPARASGERSPEKILERLLAD